MTLVVLLLLIGIFLSAFFSGAETGFYRVTRVRLVIDALDGNATARALLWLVNNPTLFVATTLIGNNVANYLTSLATVLGTAHLISSSGHWAELVAPVALSPLIFVYGELLPKNLFFQAPNRLLRLAGPLFLVFTVLFVPVSVLLWGLGRCLQWLIGQAPETVRLALARKELQQVLEEGHHAGILQPAQRRLAQSLFAVSPQPVTKFCKPAARVASVPLGTPKSDVLRLAKRHGLSAVPVTGEGRRLVGYVRVVDLCLAPSKGVESTEPLPKISATDTHSSALMRMQSAKAALAEVVGAGGETVGLLPLANLTQPLFPE